MSPFNQSRLTWIHNMEHTMQSIYFDREVHEAGERAYRKRLRARRIQFLKDNWPGIVIGASYAAIVAYAIWQLISPYI